MIHKKLFLSIFIFTLIGAILGYVLPKPPIFKTPSSKNKPSGEGSAAEIVTPKNARLHTGGSITADLKINTDSTYYVDPQLFNFSLGFMFGNTMDEMAEVRKLIKDLKPNIFRFPGGTVANFYHVDGAGYGMKENEVQTVPIYQLNQKSRQNMSNNMIDRFIPLVKENNAKVLLVANMYTSSPDEIVAMAKQFRANGIEIVGIELGNELYFKVYEGKIPDGETYLAKCKEFVPVIKAYDKTIPLGVVACPIGGSANKEKFLAWNKLIGKQDFYDAYIIHEYTQCKACNQQETPDMDLIFNQCGMTVTSITYNNVRQFVYDYYKQFFPNKKQWITEWNTINTEPYMSNTFLQGAHNADYLLNIIDVNAANNNPISMASFHALAGDGITFPMIFYKENQKVTLNGDKSISTTASYYTFYFFRNIFSNSARKCKQSLTLSNGGTEKDVLIRSFISADKKKMYVYCINKTGSNSNLNIRGINSKSISYEYIQGSQLWSLGSSNNQAMSKKGTNNDIMNLSTKTFISSTGIAIPSFSYGILEISI